MVDSPGKAVADEIIALVHLPSVDPNFLAMSARDEAELKGKSFGFAGQAIRNRRSGLKGYIAQAKEQAAGGGSFEKGVVEFLEERFTANDVMYQTYTGKSSPEDLDMFFKASQKIWLEGLPNALDRLEGLIQENGPFMMGDQVVGHPLPDFFPLLRAETD